MVVQIGDALRVSLQMNTMQQTSTEGLFQLTDDQINYFRTFGFLKVKGLFDEEIGQISTEFDSVFKEHEKDQHITHDPTHGERERRIIHAIAEKNEYLSALREAPKMVELASRLIDKDYKCINSDGSRFFCDSNWHADIYGAPLNIFHLKVSIYLESLRGNSGAIRVLPGSHNFQESYARDLRKEMNKETSPFGVGQQDIPGYVVETDPGDAVIWAFRVVHGSFNGNAGRRLLSYNFSEAS